MALSGSKAPDLSVLRMGASREEIELQLGPALNVVVHPNGNHYCTYRYSMGSEPSAGRAIGHGVMDALTVGLWESFGTPMEEEHANTDMRTVTVEYGPDMLVRKIIKEDEPRVIYKPLPD